VESEDLAMNIDLLKLYEDPEFTILLKEYDEAVAAASK
jgi:hypothetical protein